MEDFELAWWLTGARRAGRRLPKGCNEPAMLDYVAAASFGEQVSRLLAQADHRQVLFVKFDEFVKDTPTEYRRVLDFLGVEPDDRTQFPKVNVRSKLTAPLLAKAHRLAHAARLGLGITEKSPLRRLSYPLSRWLKHFNRVPVAKQSVSAALEADMRRTLREDIILLARLTGWNLGNWLDPPVSNLQATNPAPIANQDKRASANLE